MCLVYEFESRFRPALHVCWCVSVAATPVSDMAVARSSTHENWKEHTTWVDLLNETDTEHAQRQKAGEDEYAIDSIISHRYSSKGKGLWPG